MLQEAHELAKLPGYQLNAPSSGENHTLTTVVREGFVAVRHHIKVAQIEQIFIEIIPKSKKQFRTFCNLYSNHAHIVQRFRTLFKKAPYLAGWHSQSIG